MPGSQSPVQRVKHLTGAGRERVCPAHDRVRSAIGFPSNNQPRPSPVLPFVTGSVRNGTCSIARGRWISDQVDDLGGFGLSGRCGAPDLDDRGEHKGYEAEKTKCGSCHLATSSGVGGSDRDRI